jgi:hypothetical protein
MPAKSFSVTTIPRNVVEHIKGVLKDSPVKEKETFLLKEAIAAMLPEIEAILSKGYSYDEVAALFSENSVEVKGATLKKYYTDLRKATAETVAPKKSKVKPPKESPQDSDLLVAETTVPTAVQPNQPELEISSEANPSATQTTPKQRSTSLENASDGFVDMPDEL